MADKIEQYLLLAKSARGRALGELIARCTSEPGLFTFGELLDVPSIKELQSGELVPHYRLLELFAYGTLPEYKAHSASLPPVNEVQLRKLKQLTVASLATKDKVIAYDLLREQLDIPTVRDLEDFIISECFYAGIIQGKLDQRARTLLVHDTVARDVRPQQLGELEAQLAAWADGSDQLVSAIEARIAFAVQQADELKRRKAELQAKQEEMKRNVKAEIELRGGDAAMLEEGAGSFDYMDEEPRLDRADRAERVAQRPKSRRR